MNKTKIICTIGPASDSEQIIGSLVDAGMNAARLNFSHGKKEAHQKYVETIRSVAELKGKFVAILQDLQGPRIRLGELLESRVLNKSEEVRLVVGSLPEDPTDIPVDYTQLTSDIKQGERIFINDGLIELGVKSISGDGVICTVLTGGEISSRKGINFPDSHLTVPALSEKDLEDIKTGLELNVDYVALSFVRSAKDIQEARSLLGGGGDSPQKDIKIIAKIEHREAIERIDEILEAADGIMVARGDLGVELGSESVPLIQKRLIAKANECNKLVITATQMLESMTKNVRPTRAEASDVANAILDGTDAVMLSAETATGDYPIETVGMMSKIINKVETDANTKRFRRKSQEFAPSVDVPSAIASAAYQASQSVSAKSIVVFTESGLTARLVAGHKPVAPIIAFTPHNKVARQLALKWGVTSQIMQNIPEPVERIGALTRILTEQGLIQGEDRLVIVAGTNIGHSGGANLVQIHTV